MRKQTKAELTREIERLGRILDEHVGRANYSARVTEARCMIGKAFRRLAQSTTQSTEAK